MRRLWLALLILIVMLVLVLPPPHVSNLKPISSSPVKRIISLSPNVTEILFELGLGKQVVAVSDYCQYPQSVTALPKVGGYLNPSIESIIDHQPDLVIVTGDTGTLREQLHSFNIDTLYVKSESLKDIEQAIKRIGQRTGHLMQALTLWGSMKQRFATTNVRVKNAAKPKVMIVFGNALNRQGINQIYIAGQHDFYNDLIELAGATNAYQYTDLTVPSLSLESIIELNPDIIINLIPPSTTDQIMHNTKVNHWQRLRHVNAVKQNRVYYIAEDYAMIPGPRVVLLLEQLAQFIHPE